MDLVRELLAYIADNGSERMSIRQPSSDEYSDELISYHLGIMHEHGLFTGTEYDGGTWGLRALTWEGQDFLGAAENDTVWNEAKKRAGSTFGALTLGAVKELLNQVAKQLVGLG